MSNMTTEHVALLTAPFATHDHEFNYGKVIYLTEGAITTRLDEVDPNWSFRVSMVEHRADKVIVYAALTVNGVTRESNGYDEAEYVKGKDRLPEYEVNQREKAALTDALKRCARLFGIGRYILNIPKSIKTHDALNTWLKNTYGGGSAPAQSQPAAKQPPAQINEHAFDRRVPDTRKKADDAPAPHTNGKNAEPADTMPEIEMAAYVTVKVGKNNKPFYQFLSSDSVVTAYSFERAPFRNQGWDVDGWLPNEDGTPAEYDLDRYPLVDLAKAADGYWHVTRVTAYDLCDKYVEDQAS